MNCQADNSVPEFSITSFPLSVLNSVHFLLFSCSRNTIPLQRKNFFQNVNAFSESRKQNSALSPSLVPAERGTSVSWVCFHTWVVLKTVGVSGKRIVNIFPEIGNIAHIVMVTVSHLSLYGKNWFFTVCCMCNLVCCTYFNFHQKETIYFMLTCLISSKKS